MNVFTAKWPGWFSGVSFGVIAVAGLWCLDDAPGFAGSAEKLYRWCAGGAEGELKLEWPMAFCVGILIGALAAACASGEYKFTMLEEGDSLPGRVWRTLLLSGVGGFLAMFGSLLAGETPAGQFAALLQMAPGAWVYASGLAIAGVFVAVMLGDRLGVSGSAGEGKEEKSSRKGGRK